MPEPAEWPKLDPVTGRRICRLCWNLIHRVHNHLGVLVDACDGECFCVHRNEPPRARRPRRERVEVADALRAVNPDFQEKRSGKEPA